MPLDATEKDPGPVVVIRGGQLAGKKTLTKVLWTRLPSGVEVAPALQRALNAGTAAAYVADGRYAKEVDQLRSCAGIVVVFDGQSARWATDDWAAKSLLDDLQCIGRDVRETPVAAFVNKRDLPRFAGSGPRPLADLRRLLPNSAPCVEGSALRADGLDALVAVVTGWLGR